MVVKLAVLFTREIKPPSVKVCIGHALQLGNGPVHQPPHFRVHVRQGGEHPRHRPAAVKGVVYTDQIFFFHAEIHVLNLHFVLFAAGRCLFRAGGLFCFGKLLADGSTGLADTPVPVLLFVNQRIDAETVFRAGQAQGLVRKHGNQLVRVPAGCQLGEVGRYFHHKMMYEYFEIFLQWILMCRGAVDMLGQLSN